ncbi:MAG: prolyl oligopeptidase family serine peptidase [Dysgonamonadaceae bacterium]|jgi:dipeptidyl aminopeptidase/acylaminoacyl peptidase|nr:prolyl oligopeptidase family serine peptidase [Dysgonamonadaceae bacterium]
MKNKLFPLFVLIFFGQSVFSQKEIKVESYRSSELLSVFVPVIIDSVNIAGKSFSDKDLLSTPVNFEQVFLSKKILKADTSGIVSLPHYDWNSKRPRQDKAIQLLSFNIDADRFCKAKLSITCTEMFEVYIDGEKGKSKETKESDLSKSSSINVDLKLEPRQYSVVIKRLATFSNFDTPEIKTVLIPQKNDSLTQFRISLNDKRRITINDIIEGNRITGSSISHSGKYFTAKYTAVYDGGKSVVTNELRILNGNRPIYRFPSNIQPYWMPSSDRIIYYKDGVKNKDVYIFDPETLEEKLIGENITFESFYVVPDEKSMILAVDESMPNDKSALRRHLSPSDRSGSFRKRHSLFKYDFSQQTTERLTFGQTNMYVCDISPDSKRLMFMTTEEDLSERLFYKYDLLMMNLGTSDIDTLAQDRFISDASFSPDGKHIIIQGSAEAFDGIGLNILPDQISNPFDVQAFIMDLKNKQITAFAKDFNPSIQSCDWSVFDNKIYLTSEDKDRVSIYTYDTKNEKFEKLDLKEDIIADFSLSKTAPQALYRGQSVSNSYRLYSFNLKSKSTELLSDPFGEQLSELSLGKVEDWNFTTSTGCEIKGRYYLPPNFNPKQKYPMIVYFYGGTNPTSRNFESRYPLNVYAALGYVVYTLQPSGATGFGQEFSARHVNAWGEPTADEIIEGTQKFCETHSFVDKNKIGCIGASYGGFMTQFLITKTDIFSAAISHAGISSIASYWGKGYWGYSYGGAATAGNFPWNNPELFTGQSPLFHADKINTPLLLLHGSSDTNVPVGESIQMFNALKLLGKPVEFIEVEGENHSISAYKKRIDWNKTIYAWFAKWLKDQPDWWNELYKD